MALPAEEHAPPLKANELAERGLIDVLDMGRYKPDQREVDEALGLNRVSPKEAVHIPGFHERRNVPSGQ